MWTRDKPVMEKVLSPSLKVCRKGCVGWASRPLGSHLMLKRDDFVKHSYCPHLSLLVTDSENPAYLSLPLGQHCCCLRRRNCSLKTDIGHISFDAF